MQNETDSRAGDDPDPPRTSGHVKRTVLYCLASRDGGPMTVGDALEPIGGVVERGGYGNPGPRSNDATVVQRSTVRRAFNQLRDDGLVARVVDLDADALAEGPVALGAVEDGGDPADPAAYAATTDDARVTDWVLTDDGRGEVDRLDRAYAAELDDLAARYGRPRGETTARVDA